MAKEKKGELKTCCGCNLYPVCMVREATDKLMQQFGKVSKDNNSTVGLYTYVAESCTIHDPIKE